METCKPLPTPFPAKSDVVLDELLKPIEKLDPVLNKQFQEIIGQLLYCQQQTVPEISLSVSILAWTPSHGARHDDDDVLFIGVIGTGFSNFYTAVDTPA